MPFQAFDRPHEPVCSTQGQALLHAAENSGMGSLLAATLSLAPEPVPEPETYVHRDAAQVKPDDIWSIQVHNVRLKSGASFTGPKAVLACGARILHIYNMFRKRGWRASDLRNSTVTYLPALLGQPDA